MQFTVYTTRHTCGARARRTREGEGEGADGGKDNYLRCWSISQTEGGRRQSAATRALAQTDRHVARDSRFLLKRVFNAWAKRRTQ